MVRFIVNRLLPLLCNKCSMVGSPGPKNVSGASLMKNLVPMVDVAAYTKEILSIVSGSPSVPFLVMVNVLQLKI